MMRLLVEKATIAGAIVPINATGAAQDGDWVAMRHHNKLTIILMTGAWAGGTSAVTVEQATDAAGTSNKAVAFGYQYVGETAAANGDKPTKTAVTSNTFNLSAANKIHIIEIDAQDLDINNGFTHVCVKAASPGSNNDLVAALYVLHEGTHQGSPANNPTVLN